MTLFTHEITVVIQLLHKNKTTKTKKSQEISRDQYTEVCCAPGLRGDGVALRFRRPGSGYGGQRASTSPVN